MTTCLLCKNGEMAPGETTVTLQRGQTTIIMKAVPAEICDNCGEFYLTEPVAQRVYSVADAAVRAGAEVEILRFAA
ncbi:MAG: type II toxin-antitoxin system MqsA family antitoxin [Deltaproteobacteria bacterium]|nr:type II toxin-antitoxin system MqsA family antitoxin [Deltaproteobacteria bacterium]